MSGNLQQVHVRINDAATGKPTPCRVRFMDADGRYYAPHGRTADIPPSFESCRRNVGGYVSDAETWNYIDGTCEIDLPAGPLEIIIEKGPEYERLAHAMTLAAGKLALRIDLKRVFDPRSTGWYAGAITHTPLSPHEVLLEGAAEGLRVVDLLAYERESTIDGKEVRPVWRMRELGLFDPSAESAEPQETLIDYPNVIAFSGQRPCIETPDCLVAVNTLNRHAGLGELALLNCHRVVFPLRVGRSPFPGSAHHRRDNWTLADWCDQCHRKHGLVIGRSPHWSETDRWYGGEVLADAILGKIDAASLWQDWQDWWYTLLALGLRLPIVAHLGLRPLGMQRTYARLRSGQEFSYPNWIEAIRAGRTCVSCGPFLTLTANGADPGGCLDLYGVGDRIRIHAEAVSRSPFDALVLVQDGAEIAQEGVRLHGRFHAEMDIEVSVAQSGWLAAACYDRPDSEGLSRAAAHTSPIYVRVDGEPVPTNTHAANAVIGMLDRTLAWVHQYADCPTPKDRERLANVFAEAKRVVQPRRDG